MGVDFEVDFSSGQRLSALRQKIERSIAAIHSYNDIAKVLQELSKTMSRHNCMSEGEANYVVQVTNELLRTADGYIKKLEALMSSCNFTADLVGPY
jgi:hypothetical protein